MHHLPILEEPIFRRARHLQEGRSAKRLTRFATDEVHWECDTCVSCECGWPTQAETEVEFRAEIEAETDPQNGLKFNNKFMVRGEESTYFITLLRAAHQQKCSRGYGVELISECSRRSLGVELDRPQLMLTLRSK